MILQRETTLNSSSSMDSYSRHLEYLCSNYLDKIAFDAKNFSKSANEKALREFRYAIYRNDTSLLSCLDSGESVNNIGRKTTSLIRQYTRCIMRILGDIAECVVIDRCAFDLDCNYKFINLAKFEENIYIRYDSIDYDSYVPFSPSHKYIIFEKDGRLQIRNVPDRNRNHETKDIAWCKKDNIVSQLKAEIPECEYLENAKVQVKTTINPETLVLDKYITSPVVVFNLSDESIDYARDKYPNHLIIDVREIDAQAFVDIEKYFRILAAYIIGEINYIEIKEEMVKDSKLLEFIANAPIKQLLNYNPLGSSGIIKLLEQHRKPIELFA